MQADAARNIYLYEMGLWECTAAFPSPVASVSLGQGTVLCLEYFSFKNTNYGTLRVLPLQSSGAATALRGLCPRSLAARVYCRVQRALWPSYGGRCIILLLSTTSTSPQHISRKSPASYTPILPHGARDGPLSEAIGRRLTPRRNL